MTLKYWIGVQSYLMGKYDSLALVDHPSSDGVTIKILYGVDVLLNRTALLSNYSYCIG